MSKFEPPTAPKRYSSSGEHVTVDEIRAAFAKDLDGLFQLAFLLTGDVDRAAYCIEITVRACMHSQWMLKDQLAGCVRNTVIRNGIRIVDEFDGDRIGEVRPRRSAASGLQIGRASFPESVDLRGILELSDFDRLVYVLCVLEHVSMLDCAMFLGTTRQEVRDAQARAEAHITASACGWWDFGDSPVWLTGEWRAMQAMGSSAMIGTIPN
jgi:hypothetical protein